MKYTYAYKTSDGKRHEASMEAESREAVFESLRAQGIRAIKVVAEDGSKANGEPPKTSLHRRVTRLVSLVIIAVMLALAVYLGRGALVATDKTDAPERNLPSPLLVTLRTKAEAVEMRHKAAMTLAGGDLEKIRSAIAEAREEAREAFKDIMQTLSKPSEQQEAKRLYGELMLLVDESEAAMEEP